MACELVYFCILFSTIFLFVENQYRQLVCPKTENIKFPPQLHFFFHMKDITDSVQSTATYSHSFNYPHNLPNKRIIP
jgi:hypothetical protein